MIEMLYARAGDCDADMPQQMRDGAHALEQRLAMALDQLIMPSCLADRGRPAA